MDTIKHPTLTKAKKQHKCDFCCQIIEVSTTYFKSTYVYDTIYDWKTHVECSDIASKLKMYDFYDEGVTTEAFIESIQHEYQSIISNLYNELYESKDFKTPEFKEQLDFVIKHHLEKINQ